ncbi:MAG: pentapeptide repeat-containing protein, partial [Elainellaceae cyanobacterium]
MRERFKRWQPKIRSHKWWVMGAIATPVLLGIVGWLWLLPDRRLQPHHGRLSHDERVTLAHPHRETLISGIGAIAAVTGGVFLLLNFPITSRNAETADFSGADLSGADLSGADLSGASLSNANLSGADLSGASLSNGKLSGAALSGSDSSGAEIRGANRPAGR